MADRRLDPTYLDRSIQHISDADLFAALGDRFRSYTDWAAHWSTVSPDRARFVDRQFVLGPRDEILSRLTPDRDAILAAADRVLRHDIQGWGDVSIQHGPTVDFNADYGQAGKYGFHYWWWSQPLIHAHLLTSDPKYLDAFDRLFHQWYDQRDQVVGALPPLNVIWYELGLGVRNRPFLEFYSLPHATRSPATHERVLKTLLGAARWLYEEQQQGYRDGNWQIMGAYGLTWIGRMLPEFSESPDWVRLGTQRLAEHAQRDFFPDGCHSERVPSSYSVVAMRDLRNLVTLLGDHPDARPFRVQLSKCIGWFLATLPPDRILPAINDGERAPLPPTFDEDATRLGYAAAATSIQLPHSGFTVLRSDASPTARYLLINHGPHGGGHSHADCLSFQLHAFGRPLAIDSGIGRTYDDPHHTPWYTRSLSHNMLTIDGDDLDRKAATGEDVTWATAPGLEYFAATHRGYEASKGVIHRRHVAFVDARYSVIYDEVTVTGPDAREVSWNLHTPYPVVQTPAGFRTASTPGLIVEPAGAGWTADLSKGWASVLGIPDHTAGHAQIPWLKFSKPVAAGTTEHLGVLLYPFETKSGVQFHADGNARYIVEHEQGRDEIAFVDNACTIRRWRGNRLDSEEIARHTRP